MESLIREMTTTHPISELKSAALMNRPPRQPFLARLAGPILAMLYRTLPHSAYDRMYLALYPRYKAWQRRRYRRLAHRQPGADGEKIELVFKCMEHSLVGWQGLEATYDSTKKVLLSGVEGDLVECGVAQGGSALLLGLLAARHGGDRKLWLFDSFEGLPDPTTEDFQNGKTGQHVRPLPKGSCLGTISEVEDLLFTRNQLSPQNITLVKGWFQDALPKSRLEVGRIALLRLDGDWYDSTKTCLDNFFDQVSEGGCIILDDYFSCFGCKRATDEFLAARGKNYPIISDGRGGAFFVKRD